MDERVYISAAVAVCVVGLLTTGWWRKGFALFRIQPGKMTVARLGLRVTAPRDIERVNAVLRHFAGGFNTMISARSESATRRYLESLSVLYRPFAEEGAAMGYTVRHLFSYRPQEFETRLVRKRPEFRYLHYVGLGFWSGMRHHSASRLHRIVEGLDPLHGFLCFDGFGFKRAFFDYLRDPGSLDALDAFEGYARNAAYQGVGRAFYFLYLDDPDAMLEHIRRRGPYAADVAAGVGLACVFVNPDRLQVARDLAAKMPEDLRDHFHLGMCFGLKARSINNVEQFERDLALCDSDVRDAVFASVRECDRNELLIRSRHQPDGYRRWRAAVTEWMADHVVYPLAGLKSTAAVATPEPQASACADVAVSEASRRLKPAAQDAVPGSGPRSGPFEGGIRT